MASNNPEQREEEETDADKDEDTGAQVAPIVRTKTVVVTTGEEDEDTILDLYFLSIYYLLIDLLEISQTLTLLYTSAQKKLNEDLAKDDSDSKAMKRPPSAFFVFMGEFRNLFKQNFPENKSVAAVGKGAGEEWRSMSDSDKAPYVAMAAKKKADYVKAKEEFKNKTGLYAFDVEVIEKGTNLSMPVADLRFEEVVPGI